MSKLYTCTNRLRVAVSKNIEWAGNNYTFHVEGSYTAKGEEQVLRIDLTRDEALRLRREMNTMLRATAPPRKRR